MKKIILSMMILTALLAAAFSNDSVSINQVCNLNESGLKEIVISSRVPGLVRLVEVVKSGDAPPMKYDFRFTSGANGDGVNEPAIYTFIKPGIYRVSLNWVPLGKIDLRGFCFWFPVDPTY